MTKREAKTMALKEAAAWLSVAADCNDLDEGLSLRDEDKVREAVREIARKLESRAATQPVKVPG